MDRPAISRIGFHLSSSEPVLETGSQMIRASVPKTWTVGDKTGRCGNGATNNVAIIRPPGRAPIVVAIYSIGSTSSAGDCPAIVAEAARAVVEFLSGKTASTLTDGRDAALRRPGRSAPTLPEFVA